MARMLSAFLCMLFLAGTVSDAFAQGSRESSGSREGGSQGGGGSGGGGEKAGGKGK